MPSPHRPFPTASDLGGLIERCTELCSAIAPLVTKISGERQSFLADSLADAMAQLEVILRAVEEDGRTSERKDGRPSLLRRLFGRNEAEDASAAERAIGPPRFDVSQQGLQGNSWTVPLSELIAFLANSRKSGVLWVDSPDENFLIGLEDGQVMHASGSRTPEGLRLGEVLVGRGYLTKRQLDRFLSMGSQETATVSGEALLASGMITEDELRSALGHQVQQLFHRFVHTKNALFRFREGLQVALTHHVRLNVNQLLLDNARMRDEASNPTLRSAALTNAWNSWQADLSAKVTTSAADAVAAAVDPEGPLPAPDADASGAGAGEETRAEEELVAHEPSSAEPVSKEADGE